MTIHESTARPIGAPPDGRVSAKVISDADAISGVTSMLADYTDRVQLRSGDGDGPVDVAVLDTFATGATAVASAADIMQAGLADRVVFFTWNVAAIAERAGALGEPSGVITKSVTAGQLVDAIEAVASGQTVVIEAATRRAMALARPGEPLSARESQVAALMAEGRTNAEIAELLVVSPETVKTYASRLFRKLGARNRTQVAAWVADGGLAQTEL
ncbi:MAG: response regulator transcription factor [Acidimicrobiales bacterium]